MPKVSVIVPVYGVEKYIERCARSLFEQTLDDIEYLFIDDCTPDKSIEILKNVLANAKDTIEKWLSYFRDAKYVITDSFHGTVFSILFNKDFMVYGNNKRGNSRFNSLLGLFSLQNRLTASIPNEWPAIDWNTVNVAHRLKREESINWLILKLCQK